MLSRNLWIKYNLCNGAIGFVNMLFIKKISPNLHCLLLLWFNFQIIKYPPKEDCGQIIPIISSFNTTDNMDRYQLSMELRSGITIHKS